MKILSYECHGFAKTDLTFSKVTLQKRNLIVGASGSGKTRFINTIFNVGLMAVGKQILNGYWDITIEQEGKKYRWILEAGQDKEGKNIILKENIFRLGINDHEEEEIVRRKGDTFFFKDNPLPKLSRSETSISILKDEDDIQPLYRGFSLLVRRQFSSDILKRMASFASLPIELWQKIEKERDFHLLFGVDLPLSTKLYVLSQYSKDVYEKICNEFKVTFPFVSDLDILDLQELHSNIHPNIHLEINTSNVKIQSTDMGNIPVFALKENNVDKWIALDQWSSGMQKVLLIITDIFLLPADGGVYLLDEYENSLGVNAIHFLPSFLLDYGGNHQFFRLMFRTSANGIIRCMDFSITNLMDRKACIKWIQEHFHPEGQKCVHCQVGFDQSRWVRKTKRSKLDVRRCKNCQGLYNLYSGTVFEGRHFRPEQTGLFIRGICQSQSTAQLARELGISRTIGHRSSS